MTPFLFATKRLLQRMTLLSLFCAFSAYAEIDVVEFNDPAQAAQYQRLITELRCPKCQNNNIADSNAPLARDLRAIVYEKVQAGADDAEILAFMAERYGDFILYKPPFKPSTWALWLGPIALLLLVGFVLARWLSKQAPEPGRDLTAQELAQLQTLLANEPQNAAKPAPDPVHKQESAS